MSGDAWVEAKAAELLASMSRTAALAAAAQEVGALRFMRDVFAPQPARAAELEAEQTRWEAVVLKLKGDA